MTAALCHRGLRHWSMTSRVARLGGRLFRYRHTLLLQKVRRPMTVAEIVEALRRLDVDVPERASKTVSDALRWEIQKDRIRRTATATYVFGRMPASTGRWMRWELRNTQH